MGTFVRAVITGFGFSLGKMLFDKVKERYIDPLDPNTRTDDMAPGSEIVDATEE